MGVLTPDAVGRTYPGSTYTVTPEATALYAAATNDKNAAYERADAVAPPLFAVVPAFDVLNGMLLGPELNLPLPRLLHGEHDMQFLSAIRPDDVLTTVGRTTGMAETSTGETIDLEMISTNQHGEVRVRQLATVFIRDPEKKKSSGSQAAPDRGKPVAEAEMKVAEDQSYRYAEASGDRNPQHTNEEFAKKLGYKGVFLQGLCTMAFASQAAAQTLADGDPTRLKRLKVRFSKVVYPGDVLTTSFWEVGDGEYAFVTRDQDGAAVLTDGIAEIGS